MWRDKFTEIKKAKGISTQALADRSGISRDTIKRILDTQAVQKEGPGVETVAILCEALGVEMWEIFYIGDRSFIDLQAEISALRDERDRLLVQNGDLTRQVEDYRNKIDSLKDEIINTHNSYHRIISNITK